MTEDIKKELGKIEGMGERMRIVARQISTIAGEIEVMAQKFDRLNDLPKIMKMVDIKFYSTGSYDRATLALQWPGNINELREILKERLHVQIEEKLKEIEALKEQL
jgi:hypothetical protein